MKHPFLKSIVVIGSVAAALMSCSDDSTTSTGDELSNIETPSENPTTTVTVTEPSWVLEADQTYLINTDFIVKDANGNLVGTYDIATQTIIAADGVTPIVGNVDLGTLAVKDAGDVIEVGPASSADAVPVDPALSSAVVIPDPMSSATVIPVDPALSSAVVVPVQSSSSVQQPLQSSSSQQQQAQSSSSQQQQQGGNGGKCNGGATPWDNLKGANGEQFTYNEKCELVCHYDPTGKNCANAGTATANSSSSQQQQQQQPSSSSQQQQWQPSSSSQQQQWQPSSSSQAKSSSSQYQQGGATPNFAIKAGGRSGSGWSSRYWDCCKPHCAWSGKGGPIARTCNINQQTLTKGDDTQKSMCEGGPAALCNDQRPIIINDNLAYAFAAGPGNSYAGSCGSCFLLEFDGNSRHTTDGRTAALKGKKMVIMISNIGYDVEDGQFDMMIPGGGVGIFNGCSTLWGINNLGAQHGGLLKDCGGDKKVTDVAAMQKCLEDKCNSVFASVPDAKAGCLFHAQWLMAANNPSFKYTELESCPQELVNKY